MPHVDNHVWLSQTTALFANVIIVDGGHVDADSFLVACNAVLPVYDVIFSPGLVSRTLKSDMRQHINSVAAVKSRYPKLKYLDQLIEQEVADFGHDKVRYDTHSGSYGLLWLMRTVMFNVSFVSALADGQRRQSRVCAAEAYKAVLAPFHGYLLGGIVSMALSLCPTRESMISAFGFSGEDEVEPAIQAYCAAARRSFSAVDAFYTKAGLHFPDKA